MGKLDSRLARLEAAQRDPASGLTVAVVEHPFPSGDKETWAIGILDRLGQLAAVWVLDGAAYRVLLPPTDAHSMLYDSAAERMWLKAGKTYPHYLICGDGIGGMIAERLESEIHEHQRLRELAVELGEV